jgi:hypothetical protein
MKEKWKLEISLYERVGKLGHFDQVVSPTIMFLALKSGCTLDGVLERSNKRIGPHPLFVGDDQRIWTTSFSYATPPIAGSVMLADPVSTRPA